LDGVGLIFGGLLLLAVQADISRFLSYFGIGGQWASVTAIGLIAMAIGAAYVATGIGLWKLHEWARMVALTLAVLDLLGALVLMAVALNAGSTTAAVLELVPAVINGLIAWYLLRPDVARAFQERRGEVEVFLEPGGTEPLTSGPTTPAAPKPTKPVEQPFTPVAWLVVRKGSRGGSSGCQPGRISWGVMPASAASSLMTTLSRASMPKSALREGVSGFMTWEAAMAPSSTAQGCNAKC